MPIVVWMDGTAEEIAANDIEIVQGGVKLSTSSGSHTLIPIPQVRKILYDSPQEAGQTPQDFGEQPAANVAEG